MVLDLGSRVEDLESRAWGSGFRVWGVLASRVLPPDALGTCGFVVRV